MNKNYCDIISIRRSDGVIFKQGDLVINTEESATDSPVKISSFQLVDYSKYSCNSIPGIEVVTENGDSLHISVIEKAN